MKKTLVTLMVLLLLVNLVGCSSSETNDVKDEGTSTSSSKKQEETSTSVKSSEKQEVLIWAWDQNFGVIEYAAKKYKEEHPDENVEVVSQNIPDTVEKLSTFFASGVGSDLPDIVLMDNNQIQALLQQFPGKLVNLSERGYDEFKDSFSQAHWEVLSTEGSIYAFPFDIAPLMMQVNTEIFESAGVDPDSLETWDDVIAATPAVNEAGFGMHYIFGAREVLGMFQSAGVGIYDKEGNIDLLNPKVVEIVDIFKRLVDSKAADVTYEESDAGTGEVALAIKPAWLVGEDMTVLTDISGKVKLYPVPLVKEGGDYTRSANDGGSSWFILETSEVKDIAYEIGKYMTTDLEAQDIALSEGLMPGFLPAVELESVNEGSEYYQGQQIWKLLSESAVDTKPVFVNEDYSLGRDVFGNAVLDVVNGRTTKSAEEILIEAADLLSVQTGRDINQY